MRMNAALGFGLPMVGVSVVVAVVICSFGLWTMTSSRFGNIRNRTLIVSAVVGSAIPLLHYVGIAAARFTALPASAELDVLSSSGVSLSLDFFLILAILLSFPLLLNALFPASDEPRLEAEVYE